jgi:superfamily II DNA or RNA helicase
LCEAARRNDTLAAVQILEQSGGRFSWQTIRKLGHGGPAFSIRSDFHPYHWQEEALGKWHERGRRGVLEVVTGAGKTVLALQAMSDCHRENPETRTSVLVPTKVLMYQWAVELVRLLGVHPEEIGLRGDGHKDSFAKGKKVMVVIVNSAILDDYLRDDVASFSGQIPHLLVADECHRYRGEEFRRAFDCRADWTLGLSATPIEPAAAGDAHEASLDVVVEKLGQIFYNYSYRQALENRIIQPFTVSYFGVDLTPTERKSYDAYTKRLAKVLERIRQRYGVRLDTMKAKSFDQKLQVILKTDREFDRAILDYFTLVRERKDLVFGALNRKRCYLDLINQHREDKVIVFHEHIEDLEAIVAPFDRRQVPLDIEEAVPGSLDPRADMKSKREVDQLLEDLFKRPSFRAVMYHSGHARQSWNAIAMEWFRSGVANVMLSVKALVEGVDVPKARIGIIRTSSSSVRQRIQTTGRILRRASGKDQPAALYVIYVRETTDERIFRGTDWAEQIGSSSIESFHWYPPEDPLEMEGEREDLHGVLPVPPTIEDEPPLEVDVSALAIGALYPGRYAGVELHVDSKGRPFRRTRVGRQFISNQEVKAAAANVKILKGGGKFVVTPQGHVVTRVRGTGLVFLGETGDLEYETPKGRRVTKGMEGRPPTFTELFGETGD